MTVHVNITIQPDDTGTFSTYEKTILDALAGTKPFQPASNTPSTAPVAPAKAAKPAAKPEPEPEPEEEDVLGAGVPTLDDAIALATKLVAAGKTSDVKAALAELDCKRVGELKGSQIGQFLEALRA